jgi:nucleotide-binding universal stress UspA family protein
VTKIVGDASEPGRGIAAAGFRWVVVALDFDAGGDRALPVARSLAERSGVPVELLTVSSPNAAGDVDAYELRRRALANGWPEEACTIVRDDDPAHGIVGHLSRREGALLVMAAPTQARRSRVLGGACEQVLRSVNCPVLLVGPGVPAVFDAVLPEDSSDDRGERRGRDEERNPAEVEQLDAAACWQLLRSIRVGRLAVCDDGRPLIFPINYVVDGASIVFRTAPGTKLAAARGHAVAFEIDDYDARTQQATSVIVHGTATEITEVDDWESSLGLPLFPWDVVPKSHFVRIAAAEVSGRRFRAVYAGPGGLHPKHPQ